MENKIYSTDIETHLKPLYSVLVVSDWRNIPDNKWNINNN